MMPSSFNPYEGLRYPELCGLRKDYAKQIQGAQAARKNAERNLTMIMEAMENPRPQRSFEASDHAVVRYLERVKGINISAIREEIAHNCESAEPAIGEKMRSQDGFIYVVNGDGFITTVMPFGAVIDEVREHVAGARNKRHNRRRREDRRSGQAFIDDLATPPTGEPS